MRFLLRLLLITGLGYVAALYLPFWSAAVVAFVVCLLMSRRRRARLFGRPKPPAFAFWAGFFALAGLWGGLAWQINQQNASLLSEKIAGILLSAIPDVQLPVSAASFMILLTALIGGLMGGFSAMTGNLLGEAIKN
ncbi:MAG: hypothetical protein SF053_06605 [Bacteroidia bacterium]|nr:hypothetical protein [Bacteroidia bacterium]